MLSPYRELAAAGGQTQARTSLTPPGGKRLGDFLFFFILLPKTVPRSPVRRSSSPTATDYFPQQPDAGTWRHRSLLLFFFYGILKT